MAKLNIENVDVKGKRVLTRVDFNVPLDATGTITDDRRIRSTLPTIQSMIDRGGIAVLMSHLGRPSGSGYEAKFSLKPVADALSGLLNKPVAFPGNDCVGEEAATAVKNAQPGDVVLLENLRFHKAETINDAGFSQKLAAMGDVFCSDAFGTAHREHASMVGVAKAMGSAPRAAGLLMRDEIQYLSHAIESPERPFVAILGGAKVSDKMGAIENLLQKVDSLLIGGAMAYTFLKATERRIGRSLCEDERLKDAKRMLDEAAEYAGQLFLPIDHVCGKELSEYTPIQIFDEHIDDGWMGLDIGIQTMTKFYSIITKAKTIVWNGPVGAFETNPFDVGTRGIADAVAAATIRGATTILGGGDTAAAIERFGIEEKHYSHISTGGGASLKMLEGQKLPGVEALSDA